MIDLSPYHRATPVTDTADIVARSTGLAETAGRMVFANDRLISRAEHIHGILLRDGWTDVT